MLSYLIRQSRLLLWAAGLASVASGICSVLVVAQINAALTQDDADRGALAWRFAAAALGAMLSQMVASVMFERLSQRAHAELRRFISARVLAADYRRLEELGAPKVQSALSEHSARVADFFVSFPTILVNAIIVAGCMVYMAWLSWSVFAAAVVVIGLGSLGYHLAHLRAIRHLDTAAKEQDRLFDHFRSLVDGAKELRLNAAKRRHFADAVLGDSIETVRRERAVGMSVFVLSASWGNFLIYGFIGLVLFALVGDVPDRVKVMTGFALVFVYMVAPLETLLLCLPKANLARVSGARIDEITRQLERIEPQTTLATPAAPRTFRSVRLSGVGHRYFHEGANEIFALGPVHLSFRPGEITFLVGGNGSGKTSLAKLLAGLYRPDRGAIVLDGHPVGDADRDDYRQLFSAIFSDFHLFEQLLDGASPDLDDRGNRLLEKLLLDGKVQVKGGAFTTRQLSQGQRKRLALVVSYLEDRPFLVFDEWAADQDPLFKEVFYRELLPELRARGKCVLVISHDDRYFHLADRIVRMEDGQVVAGGDAPETAPENAPENALENPAAIAPRAEAAGEVGARGVGGTASAANQAAD
ncbi:peptide ABC transporter [Roseateles aquatilis]|uniref:Peptide ABC transporter n=1 Tax=Roseateles aquatilis TaxID=431061 RepID=A0A246JDW0_9BURK|nr:cyclic peptide export ABC transporter [Roseateles aquatilis]OWQ90687.1 peptide ABC transporter [Roseateles aquatilis]